MVSIKIVVEIIIRVIERIKKIADTGCLRYYLIRGRKKRRILFNVWFVVIRGSATNCLTVSVKAALFLLVENCARWAF